MTETSWLPGLLALGIGLAAGLAAALLLWRRGRSKDRTRDLELEIADLEARRDELYHRLRESTAEEAGEAERQALELAAARVLRDLDARRAELSRARPRRPPAGTSRQPAPTVAARSQASGRHPQLAGFAFGAGSVALVAILIYWALGDARPDPSRATTPAPTATMPADGDHPELGDLPPGTAERLAQLEEHLEANPQDVDARREMAHLLLAVGDLFEAFQHASALSRSSPDDPDGLYIQAVVRVAMGQDEMALDLLERTLHVDPAYLAAYLLQGLILLETGNRPAAIAVWERGLAAGGGHEPNLEHALALARAGQGFEEIVGSRPGAPSAEPAPDPPGAER